MIPASVFFLDLMVWDFADFRAYPWGDRVERKTRIIKNLNRNIWMLCKKA
jgi:hypothetical protein